MNLVLCWIHCFSLWDICYTEKSTLSVQLNEVLLIGIFMNQFLSSRYWIFLASQNVVLTFSSQYHALIAKVVIVLTSIAVDWSHYCIIPFITISVTAKIIYHYSFMIWQEFVLLDLFSVLVFWFVCIIFLTLSFWDVMLNAVIIFKICEHATVFKIMQWDFRW